MKLIAPIAITAVSAQATFDTIAYRFKDAVTDLSARFISDSAFEAQLFSHGCWCAKLADPASVGLGGNAPVDDLDQICKDWARARRCSRAAGATCEFATFGSTYEVESDNGATLCPDADSCMSETCQIDTFYISELNAWRAANPGPFTPNTSPVCPPHTTNQLNNCQDFSTTARPTTVAQGADQGAAQDALNDAGVDNTGKDVFVTLVWEGANGCDFDLNVIDPNGSATNYMGGSGSLDVDQYGTEDVNVENVSYDTAVAGEYTIELWSYGCSAQTVTFFYTYGSTSDSTTFEAGPSGEFEVVKFTYTPTTRRALPAFSGASYGYNPNKSVISG